MIVWSGYGFLVAVVIFANSLIAELITRFLTGNSYSYDYNKIPLGCSLILSSIILMLLNNYFDRKRAENKGTKIFDTINLNQVKHSLFFIPFQYWSLITAIAGVGVIIYQLVKT